MKDLRSRLHDLAGDIEPSPHLAGAARVLSRRLHRRRIAGIAAATAVALAAGTGTTAALVADTHHHRAPAVTPGDRPTPTVTALPGTLWYWSYTADGHGTVIWSRTGTAPPHPVTVLPGVEGQVALSPGGARLAWVERATGRLMVGNPDGTGAAQVAQAAPDTPCGVPSWSGNGQQIAYVGLLHGKRAVFEVLADGGVTGQPFTRYGGTAEGCWPAWSSAGADELLYSGPLAQGMKGGPDFPLGGVDMAAVWCWNPYWAVYSSRMVARRPQLPRPETAALTGEVPAARRLPVPGVLGALCLPRDVMLLQAGHDGRVDRLVLYDSTDLSRVLAVAPEPAEAATLGLLGYVGG